MNNNVVDALKNAPLFTRCGQAETLDLKFSYAFLPTINAVNESLLAAEWESFTLEARNRLTSYLSLRRPREYQAWNAVTEQYKRELSTFDAAVQAFIGSSHLDPIFKHDFDWIILSMCMESHYQQLDTRIPILFQHLLPIYQAGHIPCGWRGEIQEDPSGKPMNLASGTLLIY